MTTEGVIFALSLNAMTTTFYNHKHINFSFEFSNEVLTTILPSHYLNWYTYILRYNIESPTTFYQHIWSSSSACYSCPGRVCMSRNRAKTWW